MKSILVPTDFSDHANYALDAAARLAQRFGAKIHLFHRLALPANWNKLTEIEKEKQQVVLKKIKEIRRRFEDSLSQYPGVEFETVHSGGLLNTELQAYISSHAIDLVVMGSHGSSGKNAYFIGTNTQRVARTVHCPVLVIKEPLTDIIFDKVLFASSFNENEEAAFLRFKDFVKPFIPEIHLVAIHTSSLFDPPYIVSQEAMERFKDLCKPFACESHIYKNLSIDQGIRTFASTIGAKLIGISNHYRHPVKRMLVGSNVEVLINHSDIPVLSIDYLKQEVSSSSIDT